LEVQVGKHERADHGASGASSLTDDLDVVKGPDLNQLIFFECHPATGAVPLDL
jgi:hypothetical protein